MDWVPNDWLVFLVRWLHLIAGIMWIGNSFYFMWLDANLEAPSGDDPLSEGSLWMVHSGGFYQVERRKIGPDSMPPLLHWFKWEATFTWITGFFLLGLVYFAGQALLLTNPNLVTLSPAMTVAMSVAILAASWIIYDVLFQSRLAQAAWTSHPISLLLTVGMAYGFSLLYSGRGAFIMVGAVFGTIMVLNVWIRILPGQSRMIAATGRGETPDFEEGKRAKRRSTHNSYLTLPVLFMMLSNHAPQAYAHPKNWLLLLLLIAVGMQVRHIMILQTKRQPSLWVAAPLLVTVLIMAGILNQPYENRASAVPAPEEIDFAEVRSVIHTRCQPCHAAQPTDNTFGPMPGGVAFESDQDILRMAERIRFRAVETETMPLANKTKITPEERALLGAWADQHLKSLEESHGQ